MFSAPLKVHAAFSQLHLQQLLAAIPALFPTPALSPPPSPPPPIKHSLLLGLKELCSSRIIKCL